MATTYYRRRPVAEPDNETTWGIQSAIGIKSPAKIFATVFGVVCVLLGIVGFFITGFEKFTEQTDAYLLGLFHLTPMYNIALIGIGALWLIAGLTLTNTAAEGMNFAMGGFFILAALLAYLGALPILGIPAGFGPDVVLHIVLGVASLLFSGLIPSRR
jgi:hypothetical protein